MATNAKPVVDDNKEVTDEDLAALKHGKGEVEALKEVDETLDIEETEEESEETSEEDGQTEESQEEETEETDETESDEESSEFVKQFSNIKGDTLEEYAKGLEEAYNNSTSEALRLKGLVEAKPKEPESEVDISDPVQLFMKQKMDEEITSAFSDFSTKFPQVKDQNEYAKFTNEVSILSETILNSQRRLASPSELYSKAAVILGWEPLKDTVDGKDKLNVALKNSASISKTTTATRPKSNSKITDAQVTIAKQMGGWTEGKSDAEIRKELELVT